jgi:hypothetical protein
MYQDIQHKKFYILLTQCISVYFTVLRVNSDHIIHH